MQSKAASQFHHNLQKIRHLNLQPFRNFSSAPAATPSSKVLFNRLSAHVTEIKLNAPKALNAVDTDMCNDIITQLKSWQSATTDKPRVCLMSGVGGKAFCAGGDIVSLYKAHKGDGDKSILKDFFAREYLMDFSLS
jgi:enoyl-CoA hydratase/carnithine racemase